MAYEVETQDGIVIRGIPDNIPADHESIRAKVAKARAERDSASVTSDMTPGQRFLASIGMGMARVGRGIGQVTGLVPQSTVDEAAPRDAALSNTREGMAGEVVGNLALTAVPGMGIGSLAARGAAAVLPALVAPTVGAAVTGGAINAATTPVPTGDTRTREALVGAAGGAIGDVAARTAARVAQPIMQSETVKRLLNEGIVPTPGQATGRDSLLGRTEQKAQSVFGVGDVIKSGRDRAATEVNLAAINRGVPASGLPAADIGTKGQEQAYEQLSRGYDKIFKGKTVRPDDIGLVTAIEKAKASPILPLGEAEQSKFDALIKKALWDRVENVRNASGVIEIPADKMKSEVIGDLGHMAREYLDSTTASERALGQALRAARDAVQGWTATKVAAGNPMAAAQIAQIDKAYANHIAIDKAVERARANGGKFTPYQLQTVTKEGQPLRALANDAQSVVGSSVPNSGTIDRALVAALLGGGGGAANEYYGGPHYLTALALAPLVYSRAGSRYALGDLIPGQQTLAEMARRAAPATAQGGRALNEAWQNRQK